MSLQHGKDGRKSGRSPESCAAFRLFPVLFRPANPNCVIWNLCRCRSQRIQFKIFCHFNLTPWSQRKKSEFLRLHWWQAECIQRMYLARFLDRSFGCCAIVLKDLWLRSFSCMNGTQFLQSGHHDGSMAPTVGTIQQVILRKYWPNCAQNQNFNFFKQLGSTVKWWMIFCPVWVACNALVQSFTKTAINNSEEWVGCSLTLSPLPMPLPLDNNTKIFQYCSIRQKQFVLHSEKCLVNVSCGNWKMSDLGNRSQTNAFGNFPNITCWTVWSQSNDLLEKWEKVLRIFHYFLKQQRQAASFKRREEGWDKDRK